MSDGNNLLSDEQVHEFVRLLGASGKFNVYLSGHEVATCYYHLPSFWQHIRDESYFLVALTQVMQQRGLTRDRSNRNSLEALIEANPDLTSEAQQLADKLMLDRSYDEFMSSLIRLVYAQITPEVIEATVNDSLKSLSKLAADRAIDALRQDQGLQPRSAKERKRTAHKIAGRSATTIAGIRRGPRPGRTHQAVRCNYEKLQQAILKHDPRDGTHPRKIDVAHEVGYTGSSADDALGTWLRNHPQILMDRHHHTSTAFQIVAKEIIERAYR
jgi:hypothetical protein